MTGAPVRPRVRGAVATVVALVTAAVVALGATACGSSRSGGQHRSLVGQRLTAAPVFAHERLWVNPHTAATWQIARWRATGQTRAADALHAIAEQPTAVWLTDGRPPAATVDPILRSAAARHEIPQFVLYDIPGRDCHGYSAGGATDDATYLRWVTAFAAAVGGRRAIVVVEPDALAQAATAGCLSTRAAADREHLLGRALAVLAARPGIRAYLDAGHPGWISTGAMAHALHAADVTRRAGFALNVANFQTDTASVAYGNALSADLHGAHYVIDSSRNGAGPPAGTSTDAAWCNPPGRRIGRAPTTDTGQARLDAYLWIKYPGVSDGDCGHGDPPAGTWWPRYAMSLLGHAPVAH